MSSRMSRNGDFRQFSLDWRTTLGASLAFLLISCGHTPTTVAQTAAPAEPPPEPVPHSREANDVGRFLAGLPGNPDSPFLELEKEPAWIAHRRETDKAWTNIESKTLPSMREFQAHELTTPSIQQSLVFYPFSGPDALMLTVFFPKNSTYVLVALEPPGTLPTPKQLSGKNLARVLEQTRETLADELQRSFFITRQMDRQFRGQVTDGLFSPIVQLLVRSNHTILGHRMVRIAPDGKVTARGEIPAGEIGNRGVQIEFQTDADHSVHQLYYFSINLSDVKMKDNKGFLTYLDGLKGVTTYFKATSYMTHHPEFSIIRDEVLARSAAVLQDDSGIPYHFFREQPWHVQLYGEYVRPYGSFRWLEQPDLRKAYEEPDHKPLNFQIGYGFRRQPSNLLFASKNSPPSRKD
ncbi:MAG TPA: hypothetical protein VKU19_01240 [Bryobacteraceae bacterium]|nr:hypothetical protein [Bryobacteraceae bacterium]